MAPARRSQSDKITIYLTQRNDSGTQLILRSVTMALGSLGPGLTQPIEIET